MDKAEVVFEKLSLSLAGLTKATGALKASVPGLLQSVGQGSMLGAKFYGKEVAKGLAIPGAAVGAFMAGRLSKNE